MTTLSSFRLSSSIIFIVAALTFASCAGPKLTLDSLSNTLRTYDVSELPVQSKYPDADAVIIIDQTDNEVVIERNDLYTFETHHIVKKLFRNISDEATVSIYIREDEELVDIKARTHRVDGSIVDLKPTEFYTLSGLASASTIFANVKTVRFTFPAAEKDCIVEYKFKKKNDRPFVGDTWRLQNDLPTLRNQYTLSMPELMSMLVPYKYKAYPESMEMKPLIVVGNNRYRSMFTDPITFIWSRENVPAFKPEEMMPPPESYRAQVRFTRTAWNGWNGIAEWYYQGFFKSQLVVSDTVKALAQRLTAADTTDAQRMKSVYDFVRQIRYVSVQLGESGLRPNTPQQILKNNYGDCKDKAILTIALLKSVGVTAYPVLVLTANSGIFDPNFASWNFNHMIVKSSDKEHTYWMDPTSEFSPFNSLPWQDQNIPVLTLLSETSGRIEQTPESLGKDNVSEIAMTVGVTSEGAAHYSAVITNKGEEARFYRSRLSELSYTDLKEFCMKMIINDAVRAEIDTIVMTNMKEIDSSFILHMTFTLPAAMQQQGDISFFSVNVFKMVDDMRWTAKETRKYPVWYPFDHVLVKQSVIRFIDSTLTVRPLPEDKYIQNGYLFYDGSIKEKSRNVIVAREKLHVNSTIIPSSDYHKVKTFYEKVKTSSERPIMLERKKK